MGKYVMIQINIIHRFHFILTCFLFTQLRGAAAAAFTLFLLLSLALWWGYVNISEMMQRNRKMLFYSIASKAGLANCLYLSLFRLLRGSFLLAAYRY
jgi:hypothetical protein